MLNQPRSIILFPVNDKEVALVSGCSAGLVKQSFQIRFNITTRYTLWVGSHTFLTVRCKKHLISVLPPWGLLTLVLVQDCLWGV